MASPLTVSIAIVIISGAALWSFLRNLRRNGSKSPPLPGPRGLPIVGYLPFLRRTILHRQFAALAVAHGPIYKIQAASKTLVVISSPALAREVLRVNESTFSTRVTPIAAKIFSYGGNDVAMLPFGPNQTALRKVLARELLSNRALDTCRALRERAVVEGIRREIRVGQPTGVYDVAFKVVLDSILAMLWGGGGGHVEEEGGGRPDFAAEYGEAIREMTELLGRPDVADAFPLLARFDLQGIQRESAAVAERFDRIISSVIERRLEDLAGKKGMVCRDLLQILLEIQSCADDDATLGSLIASSSSIHFKALILDIANGGTDNTTTLIEWTMTELLYNDETMIKVRQELDQVVGPGNLVEDHNVKELNYLNAVVKETCRLHGGIVARVAGQPCTIGSYQISKGDTIFINIWAIQGDPQLWADPRQFKPERFLDDAENGPKFNLVGNNFQFMPFGSGQRACAGLNLSERLMKYVLASMLHSFDWRLPDGENKPDFSDKFGVSVKKEKPLIAIPFPRTTV